MPVRVAGLTLNPPRFRTLIVRAWRTSILTRMCVFNDRAKFYFGLQINDRALLALPANPYGRRAVEKGMGFAWEGIAFQLQDWVEPQMAR
jgi:hypothetical protein